MSDEDIRTWYPDESGGRPVMILIAAGNSYETSDESQFVLHSDYVSRISAKAAEIAEARETIADMANTVLRLNRERNEALSKYNAVVDKYDAAVDKAIALTQERDEARECVGRLWPLARRVIRDAPDELPEKPADALGHEAQFEWAQDIALCFAVNDLRAALSATPERLR